MVEHRCQCTNAIMTHLKAEQLNQKFAQGSTPRQESKSVEKPVQKAHGSAEIRRRTEASAQARLLRPDYPQTGLEEINGNFPEADLN